MTEKSADPSFVIPQQAGTGPTLAQNLGFAFSMVFRSPLLLAVTSVVLISLFKKRT